jgi:hypothetical protein
MTVVDMVIIALMALCVVIQVGEPLIRHAWSNAPNTGDDQERDQLMLQKEMVYGAIRDLDFDFHTNKVDQDDYAALRQQLESDAVRLLRQLDTVDPLVSLDTMIEQHVHRLRQQSPATSTDPTALLCSGCHTPQASEAHFCPVCGQALRLS